MSTKVNLAPEVYQNSLRLKARKQLAVTISAILGLVCGGLVLVSLIIMGGQYAAIAKFTDDIKSVQRDIQAIPDLKNAVTVQQHLSSWQSLQSQLAYTSKFYEALQSVIPQQVTFTSLTAKDINSFEVSGSAKSYATIDKLVKALQAANVEIGNNASKQNTPYFSDVKVSGASSNNTGGAEFKLSATVSSEVTRGN